MQRSREFTKERLHGMGFVGVVVMVIMSCHCTYVFLVYGPRLSQPLAFFILFVYHLFFVNLVFAFYQCIMTDPGIVPPNWGFYMGDETKRRRYCKMCNVLKPDRTHHCSICNRCILNMDHHCPWINNCVGFYNRKFFFQFLLYVYSSIWIMTLTSIPEICHRIYICSHYYRSVSATFWVTSLMIVMMFCVCVLLLGTLTNFIRFHIKLVLDNYTTIENLERDEGAKSKFDIGKRRNWEQVFGSNPMLWWLPMHTLASRPVGDGVRWRVHYTRVIDEDEEAPS